MKIVSMIGCLATFAGLTALSPPLAHAQSEVAPDHFDSQSTEALGKVSLTQARFKKEASAE